MRKMLVATVGLALIALFANVQGADAQEFHWKAVATKLIETCKELTGRP